MIVIFDLDNTLYDERTYVRSGFRNVAMWASVRWNKPAAQITRILEKSLRDNGRGRNFDDLAAWLGDDRSSTVRKMISVYRHHVPDITLSRASRRVLNQLTPQYRLYLVTDGHKIVQGKKLEALGVQDYFVHCYLTNRYGIRYQKPSTRVFELIQAREGSDFSQMVYVGDDPSKDFCGLRPLGIRTIRVRTGPHAEEVVSRSMDAEVAVDSIDGIFTILERWSQNR